MGTIVSVGADIENISKFEPSRKNMSRLNRIFTKNELRYSLNKKYPAAHLAVRFATKEAVSKAIASAGLPVSRVDFQKIEVVHDKYGAPRVKLHGTKLGKVAFHVSLSHSDDAAIAIVIIVK